MAAPVAMDDAIPLVDAGGTVGRNSIRDIRLGLLGSILSPAAGGGGVGRCRPGVLPRAWNGSGFTDLLVTARSTASAQVDIGAGAAVVERTGQGPYACFTETPKVLTADAADASNPRRDIVYCQLRDGAAPLSDPAPHGPVLGIVNGTPAATPADPALPVGAIPLARLRRDAGVNTVAVGKVDVLRRGAGIGAHWTALEGDSAADPGAVPGELRWRWAVAPLPAILDVWGTDNAWHGVRDIFLPEPGQTGINANFNAATTATIATIAVPDPGWAYRIVASGSFDAGLTLLNNSMNNTAGAIFGEFSLDTATWSNGRIGSGISYAYSTSLYRSDRMSVDITECRSGVLTGQHTLRMLARNGTNSRAGEIHSGGSYRVVARIVPEP